MTKVVTLYHNPRCSKSRETLTLLQEKGLALNIIAYLDTPPNIATLKILLKQLGFNSARQLMRVKEPRYHELDLANTSLSQQQLLEAMVRYPELIERPIVVYNDKAKLGRPPEQVLDILP